MGPPLSVPNLPLSAQQCNDQAIPEQTNPIPKLTPTLPVPPHTENFNPAAVDISDAKFIRKLKRKQLNELCFYHRISAGGTNEAIISRLLCTVTTV